MKRIISLLMVLVLCCTMLPSGALALDLGGAAAVGSEAAVEESVVVETAEEAAEAPVEEAVEEAAAADGATSGSCGDNLTWSLADGVLTISGTGAMWDFTNAGAPWCDLPWLDDEYIVIESIVIKDGVASIGEFAFAYLYYVTSVTIPDSIVYIADYAFYQCNQLTTVNYAGSLYQWHAIVIGFAGEPLADTINFGASESGGKLNTKLSWKVTNDGTLTISGSGAMPDYFYDERAPWYDGRKAIKSIAIKKGVTTIGAYAFFDCDFLNSVTIPNSVTTIGDDAFSFCELLSSVTIPNSVTTIGAGAFESCDSLNSVTIPNSVTTIGSGAFAICDSLSTVTISNGVTTIGARAFESCDSLNTVTIPSSVTTIGEDAFYGCDSLTTVNYDGTLLQWAAIDGYPYFALETETITFAKESGGKLNANLSWKVTIDGTLTISGSGAMPDYFDDERAPWYDGRKAIKSIAIKKGVTTIGAYAFFDCDFLNTVTISNSVTTIGEGAFDSCNSLNSVTIPNSVTTIGEGAFDSCNSLNSVTIPNSVTTIGAYAFYGCDSLNSVTIPNSVTTIGEQAFALCDSLSTVTISNGVTTIGEYVFFDCDFLNTVTIPNSVTTIGEGAFDSCNSLNSVTIPNSVTTIGAYAFCNCYSLNTVTIPNSVTTIGERAFDSCSGLEKITVLNPSCIIKHPEDIPEYIFMLGPQCALGIPSQTTVYGYPGSTAETYAATHGFSFSALTFTSTAPIVTIGNKAENGKPKLTWSAVDGAAKYEIWRSASKNGTYSKIYTTTNTFFNNTSAVAGKTYYYKVRAVYADGAVSDFSSVKNMTCDYARPSVSITTNASTGKPKLTWNAVSGATKYEIWRATSRTGTYTKIYTTSNTYFNNTTATANKSYYYKVRAIGSSSYATSAYSSIVSITCDCAKPVVSISCNASTGKPKLTWSAVSGATKYEIWRATSRTGTYTKIYTTSNTYFNNTTATANKSYYYKVRAIGSSSYATSAYSSIASITCDCARPVVTASTNSSGKPKLTWDAVDGAVKYEIWRSGYRNGTYTKIYTTTNTYFNNTSAKSGYTYFYKVRAVGTSSYATSAYSSIVSAKCK